MATIQLLTLRVQNQYGWSYAFANAYACARYIEGMSHERALREAMNSPYVRGSDKPRAV
jgi:hypothetical protein